MGKFETYATFRIRGNIIDGFLRRQTPITVPMREDTQPEYSESEDLPNESADPSADTESTLIEEEEHERRCRHLAFAHLGETEARVVKLKHMHGQTLKEICEVEQRSTGWVHCRVRAGERQLREALLAAGAE